MPPKKISKLIPKKAAKLIPSARASLEKRPLKVIEQVSRLDASEGLTGVLGPQVGKRHSLAAYRTAARKLLLEREEARARRRGEPLLTESEQAALGEAGSRLLGIARDGSPLAALSDEALEAIREERDPGKLAESLGEIDPEGGWNGLPRIGVFTGLVLVAAQAEAERRWRVREAENLARIRSRRGASDPS